MSQMHEDDHITIPLSHDGLVRAARKILRSQTSDVVIKAIEDRDRWQRIKKEYRSLISEGVLSKDAIQSLAEKHFYSEKTIQAILYSR